MNNRPSSVNAKLTVIVQKGWVIDKARQRASTHLARVTLSPLDNCVNNLRLRETFRLIARESDFTNGLPLLVVGQKITIDVHGIPTKYGKGERPLSYCYLVPRFGMSGRPHPTVLKVHASSAAPSHPSRSAAPSVVVSLVGEFTGKGSLTDNGIKRRFFVDPSCISGGCAGKEITLFVRREHITLVNTIPDKVVVELFNVRVSNKGTHSYAATTDGFTTDYDHPSTKLGVAIPKTPPNSPNKRGITARVQKTKPVRGKFK